MAEYTKASDEVLHLARELIAEYHPNLEGGAIGFIFREDPQMKGGKRVLGTASKIPGRIRPFVDLDFIITLDAGFFIQATPLQKRALIDHELCHCEYNEKEGEDIPTLRPHDFEEFAVILERYGFWSLDLQEARESFAAALQLPLPGFRVAPAKPPVRLVSIEPAQMETMGDRHG